MDSSLPNKVNSLVSPSGHKRRLNSLKPQNKSNFQEEIRLKTQSHSQPITPQKHIPKEVESELYLNKGRSGYIVDSLWKIDIPISLKKNTIKQNKSIQGRNGDVYQLGFLYYYHESTVCASAAFFLVRDPNPEKIYQEIETVYQQFSTVNSQPNIQIELKEDKEKSKTQSSKTNSTMTNKENIETDSENMSSNSPSLSCSNKCPIQLSLSLVESVMTYKSFSECLTPCHHILNIPTLPFTQNRENLTFVIELKINNDDMPSNTFIGLINEGMTCYMNSMIQSLNNIGLFKKSIYTIPFDEDKTSLTYSLQRLLYDLTFGEDPASTNNLIKSFGWSRDDIFVQHDVQEFNLMLSDLMEKKMKGTECESIFKYLFEGKIANEIKCVDYDYKSRKEEKFNDLQLNVKNCKNIYESFAKFTEEELLDDMYEVENHGKEKAKKKISFITLPPVLMCQLKRFEFNPQKSQMDKINDYYEFYDTINLSRFVDNAPENEYEYKLISVVVHRGNVFGGHYLTYLRPTISSNWYCINDERVSTAQKFEVFDINYGGNYTFFKYKSDTNTVIKTTPKAELSAYLLIYIKVNQSQKILTQLSKTDIPAEVINRIERDKKIEKIESEKEERKRKNIDVYFTTKDILQHYTGLGITKGKNNIDDKNTEELYSMRLSIDKTYSIKTLYNIISELTDLNSQQISLYYICFTSPHRIASRFEYKMHFLGQNSQEDLIQVLSQVNEECSQRARSLLIYISTDNLKFFSPLIPNTMEMENEMDDDIYIDEYECQLNSAKEDSVFLYRSNKFMFNKFFPRCFEIPNNKRKVILMKKIDVRSSLICIDSVSDVLVNNNGDIFRNEEIIEIHSRANNLFRYYINYFGLNNKVNNYGIVYLLENTFTSDEEEEPKVTEANTTRKLIRYTKETLRLTKKSYVISILYNFESLLKDNSTDSYVLIPFIYDMTTNMIPFEDELIQLFSKAKYQINININYVNRNHECVYIKTALIDISSNPIAVRDSLFNSFSKEDLKNLINNGRQAVHSLIYIYDHQTKTNKQITFDEFVSNEISSQNMMFNSKKSSKNQSEIQECEMIKYVGAIKKTLSLDFYLTLIPPSLLTQKVIGINLMFRDSYGNTIGDVNFIICNYPSTQDQFESCEEFLKNLNPQTIQEMYGKEVRNLEIWAIASQEIIVLANNKPISYLIDFANSCSTYIVSKDPPKEDERCINLLFQTTDENFILNPIMINVNNNIKVIELKEKISEIITHNNIIKNYPPICLDNWKKIKLYTYSSFRGEIIKEMLILAEKDEEKLLSLFKHNEIKGIIVCFIIEAPNTNNNE